jgi:hypothetical protein
MIDDRRYMLKPLNVDMKAFFVGILISLTFSSLVLMVKTEAASSTVVEVKPQKPFAQIGETFTVNITVANVQNLYGVEVALYWDPSILKLLTAEVQLDVEEHPHGVLYKPISVYKNETFQGQGKYIVAGSSTAPAPSFNGSGNIVRVTFNVTNLGSCELGLATKLASNLITTTGVAPIKHETVNGFYYPIQISASPKTITLGENISISGLIAVDQANVPVTVLYRHGGETEWHTIDTITTDEQGRYSYIWTPEKSGRYYVKCTAIILGVKETSSVISIDVGEPEQPLWLYGSTLAAIIMIGIATLLIYRKRTRRSRKTR